MAPVETVESSGPSMWEAAAHNEIPKEHWEYQFRKLANEGKGDAAYNSLAYSPCCPHQPVCQPKCEFPLFVWKKK